MRLPAIPLLLSAALCSLPAVAASPTTAEQAAARKPLEAYIKGHATGDAAYMR